MTEWFDDDEFWGTSEAMMFGDAFEQAPGMVEQVLALSGISGGDALDLCCGPGRHSLELVRRGFTVTGVDRTERFLDDARRRASDAGVDLELVREDMRRFRRDGAFDLAINLFTSFGYFEDPRDDLTVLENLHASLRPEGAAVIDLFGKEILARIFRARDWQEVGDELWLFERTVRDGWSWLDNRWIVVRGGERRELVFGHRVYAASELAQRCLDAGFASTEVYGGLDGRPYDDKASRLVVVARKSEWPG